MYGDEDSLVSEGENPNDAKANHWTPVSGQWTALERIAHIVSMTLYGIEYPFGQCCSAVAKTDVVSTVV